MHAVVRRYTGVSALIEEMQKRQSEVEELLGAVPGFSAYYAIRDGDALTTVTVCDSAAGTQESTGVAAAWVRDNLPGLAAAPPAVNSGEVFLSLSS